MSHEAFDVVIVPDFDGRRRATFEARCLFFLASWLEYAGTARSFPLHIACIGRPPGSVLRLAEKCNAAISVHEPVRGTGRVSNKLRGLEVSGRTDMLLLLDVDILVLSDLGDFRARLPPRSISAALAGPVPIEDHWPEILSGLGLSALLDALPVVRPDAVPTTPARAPGLPYLNAGVVFLPWECDARDLWERYTREIAAFLRANFDEESEVWRYWSADGPGFALTVECLRRRGMKFAPMPADLHGRWRSICLEGVRLSQMKLFHLYTSFVGYQSTTQACRLGIGAFQARTIRRLLTLQRKGAGNGVRRVGSRLWPALIDVHRCGRILRRLRRLYVLEALKG